MESAPGAARARCKDLYGFCILMSTTSMEAQPVLFRQTMSSLRSRKGRGTLDVRCPRPVQSAACRLSLEMWSTLSHLPCANRFP